MNTKPESIEEVELWKIRASASERRAISAEIKNAHQHLDMLNKDFDELITSLQKKYAPAQILQDGKLEYPKNETPLLSEVKEEKEEE
jgi:hypothetical protein